MILYPIKNNNPKIKGTLKSVTLMIRDCCKKARSTAYGYKWEHHNED